MEQKYYDPTEINTEVTRRNTIISFVTIFLTVVFFILGLVPKENVLNSISEGSVSQRSLVFVGQYWYWGVLFLFTIIVWLHRERIYYLRKYYHTERPLRIVIYLFLKKKFNNHPITFYLTKFQYHYVSKLISNKGKEFLLWTLSGNPESSTKQGINETFARYNLGSNKKYRLIIYDTNPEFDKAPNQFVDENSKSFKFKKLALANNGKLFITSKKNILTIICQNCKYNCDVAIKGSLDFEFGFITTSVGSNGDIEGEIKKNSILFETGFKSAGNEDDHSFEHINIYPLNPESVFIESIKEKSGLYSNFICQQRIANLFINERHGSLNKYNALIKQIS